MTTLNTQLGVANESTYGTPVTPTRFFEYNTESLSAPSAYVESRALRTGTRTLRSDRFEPYRNGAAGQVTFDVPTKGFGFWLQHMLGAVSSSAVVDANTTHTGTEGSLLGDFFTLQLNKPLHPTGTSQAFTYHGCKVVGWELACDVEGVLTCSLDIDAEDEDNSTALAVASYPTDYRIFSFAGASITIGGSAIDVSAFRCGANLALDVDRRYMRANPLKREPTENGMREYTWNATVDFADLTQYNRVVSATRAGSLAQIVATFDGPVAHGGTTLPRLTVTIPAARFDEGTPNVSGPEGLTLDLGGIATFDGTNSPVSIAYRTTDATP